MYLNLFGIFTLLRIQFIYISHLFKYIKSKCSFFEPYNENENDFDAESFTAMCYEIFLLKTKHVPR